jgi:membrane protease YdiL (CAAX protease family)
VIPEEDAPPLAERPGEQPCERLGLELVMVLLVSLGMSGIYAVLSLLRSEVTVTGGIGNSVATVISGQATVHQWLDILDDLADILHGLAPPLLALVLLARTPGGRGFGVGFDTAGLRSTLAQGVGFFALVGLPGLGLVYLAHEVGANASLQVVSFPDVWYRVPYLLLSAAQNGLSEEVIVVAYMLTRLRQIGWSRERALIASAVLRGSYHLYQGFGAFVGNAVMGLIFGWWFQRSKRVLPLVIAHFLLDAASFIGYVYLHDRISWI